jgi:hypothetical protein
LWACCMASGICGVDPSPYLSILPILPACMTPQPPGAYDATCPTLQTSAGYVFAPCCATDGTCGVSLDTLGVGCQSDAQFGLYQPCGLIVSPPPPVPGPVGAGGDTLPR